MSSSDETVAFGPRMLGDFSDGRCSQLQRSPRPDEHVVYAKLSPTRSPTSFLRAPISREQSPTCMDFYIPPLLILRTEICKTANTHNLIGLLSARANIPSAPYVRFTQCRRKKNFRKWTWRREIFRVASGQTPDGIRGTEKLAGAAECNERKAEAKKKEETGKVRKWAGIVTAAGLRGPGGQDAKQKGRKETRGASLLFEREKSVILPCVTRITRTSLLFAKSDSKSNVLSRKR